MYTELFKKLASYFPKWLRHLNSHQQCSSSPFTPLPALNVVRLFSGNKITGVGSHSLLQGNLPDSGIKPRSPALQAILYGLSHQTLNQAPKPYEVVSLIIFILQMNKPRSKEVMHNLCSQLTGCSPARKWYHWNVYHIFSVRPHKSKFLAVTISPPK